MRRVVANGQTELSTGAVADELDSLSGPFVARYEKTFRSVLEDAIDKDSFVCLPPPRDVFFGNVPDGERTIRGTMPHYGFFYGPMRYVIERRDARWYVRLDVRVEPPPERATLQLPDCELGKRGVAMACSGSPYVAWLEEDVCNTSGSFAARATPDAVRALLARWSSGAEAYFNRDAAAFGLPITYDFEFSMVGDPPRHEEATDAADAEVVLPLWPTCGRTPYFTALRSGWPLPVLAHEMGHLLGLLDEYENMAEAVGLYLKSPSGLELSRMGESRKEGTRVLPLHHYLILRRYFCREPRTSDPYAHALP